MKKSDENSKRPQDPFHRFFGRRKGQALSSRKQNLIDTLMPKVGLVKPSSENLIDIRKIFEGPIKTVRLEIGFGKGEHLAWQAAHNPDVGFIGCEPFINGVAGLLTRIDEENLSNIRVYSDDARDILEALPDGSVDMVFLLHPDPWPKYRHARRRFISTSNLNQISRILTGGGEFRVGTDHPVYRQWTAMQMANRADFVWLANSSGDWIVRPDDWPQTRYERKALEGNATYLRYKKIDPKSM